MGRAFTDLSRFAEAEAALLRARELAVPKTMLFVYCDLGYMFRCKGDHALAEEWYRRAIDHSPDDTEGYIFLGGLLARSGRLAEAEVLHRRAITCTAGSIDEAYLNLGLVLRAQEQYAEALAAFQSAMKLDPHDVAARRGKRDVLRALRLLKRRGPRGSGAPPRLDL